MHTTRNGEETYLKEDKEVVKFPLLRSAIEAHAARVQQHAHEPDAEEVVWHVDGARELWHGMTLGCGIRMYVSSKASPMSYDSRCPNVTNAQSVSKIKPELMRR